MSNIYVRGALITLIALVVTDGDTQILDFWIFVVAMNLLINRD